MSVVLYQKTLVCLANSRKPAGRCIAGRVLTDTGLGEWVRPVSERPGEEVSEEERRYSDGEDVTVGDIVRIPFLQPKPHLHQVENQLLDPDFYWTREGRASWEVVVAGVQSPRTLWTLGMNSTHGCNDRVDAANLAAAPASLYLIQPQDLVFEAAEEGGQYGPPRRKVRASFTFGGQHYALSVTDPVFEATMLKRTDPVLKPKREVLLCVSLGEVFHGFAYKLVATVLWPKRLGSK